MKIRSLVIVIGLAILCAIAYSNAFYKDFQYDDIRLIRFNFALRDPAHWKAVLGFEPFRSLSTLSYAVDFFFSGKETTAYHVTNLALHVCNVAVFFLLLKRISGNSGYSAIAAALMAAHPLNTESVTYIASRPILLCALFYLLSLLIFDSFLKRGRTYFLLLFSLTFFLALLSKEEAATIPISALAYNFFFYPEKLRKYRAFHIAMIGFVIVAGALRIASHLRYTTTPFPTPLSVYWPTQTFVWLQYLWLALFPVRLNVSHEIAPLTFYNAAFLISLLAILLFAAALVYGAFHRSKAPLVTFWGFWFFLNLIPASLLPLNDFMAEHRTYLSLFGFCAAAAYLFLLFQKPSGKPSPVITAALLFQICFYTGAALKRNEIWQDPIILWTDSVKKSPHSIPARMNLASALIRNLQFPEAGKEYRYVLSTGVRIPGPYSGLGYVNLNERNFPEAEKNFRAALSIDPQFTDAKTGLGILAYEQARCAKALDYFRQIYAQRRESVDLMRMMSECAAKTGDYDAAIAYMKQAVALAPAEPLWRKQLEQLQSTKAALK